MDILREGAGHQWLSYVPHPHPPTPPPPMMVKDHGEIHWAIAVNKIAVAINIM